MVWNSGKLAKLPTVARYTTAPKVFGFPAGCVLTHQYFVRTLVLQSTRYQGAWLLDFRVEDLPCP